MKDLIDTVGDGVLPAFLMSLLVFGFAPGFVLRLIVRLYPKDDLRRRELVAELYVMKRLERPMWVAEQIETAIFEGPAARTRERTRRPRTRPRTGTALISAATSMISHVASGFVGIFEIVTSAISWIWGAAVMPGLQAASQVIIGSTQVVTAAASRAIKTPAEWREP